MQTGRGWPIHERFTAVFEDESGPTVRASVRMVDGLPVVERLVLERPADAGGVAASDLLRVHLRDLFAQVEADTRIVDIGAGDMPVSGYGAVTIDGLRRRRNAVTPDRLRDVAVVYDEAGRGSERIKASLRMGRIADALGVSSSQAYKLVDKARTETDPRTGKPYITDTPSKERRA